LIFVVLLGYAPGLLKEAAVVAQALGADRVRLVLNRRFAWMGAAGTSSPVYGSPLMAVRAMLKAARAERDAGARPCAYLYNNHWLNPVVALLGRLSGAYATVVACHEPPKSLRNTSLKFRIKAWAAGVIQTLSLRLAEAAVVFSEHGAKRFRTAYPRFRGRLVRGRLLIPDPEPLPDAERVYLSFPGRPNGSTGHHRFYRIARDLALTHGLKLCLLYPGAPSSPFWTNPDDLAREGLIAVASRLSDAEIFAVFGRSTAILRLDETSTQSGTIPVAFACSTPVIVRNAPGLTEFVQDGQSGVVVGPEPDAGEIARALETIGRGAARMQARARKTYLAEFSPASAGGWLSEAFAPYL
jgi:glycosyltransferase involved in cell wall biosynthesis